MTIFNPNSGRSMRPFFILWFGQAISLLGSQLVQFALIWWLTQQTGSGTVLALASIVGLLPQVLLGPFAGVLVDRWNRRWTMILADSAVALSTVALVLLFWADVVQIWQVFAILFIRALGGTFHWPAMQASVSLIVPKEQLTRVQGLNQMLNGGLNILSAPLGALLISLIPMQGILAIDVITALIAIGTLVVVLIPQPPRSEQPAGAGSAWSSFWEELAAGLRYVRSWRGLLALGLVAMLINMVLSPTASLMPLLVTDHFQGTALHLGALEAAIGIGTIAGGALLSVWGGFKRRIITSLMGVVCLGLGVIVVGLTPASLFPLAVAAMLLVGVMSSMANGPIMAIFQAVVDPEMQGRVFTLVGSAASAMMPLGLLIAGPLSDIIGVRAWFIIGGLVTVLVGLSSYFVGPLRTIEDGRTATVANTQPGGESVLAASPQSAD